MKNIKLIFATVAALTLASTVAAQKQTSGTGTTTQPTSSVQAQPSKAGTCGSDTAASYSFNLGDQSNTISTSCRTAATQTPVGCNDQGVSWGPGNICAGNIAATGHGSNRSVINNTAKYSGNATFQCVNGTYQITGSPTCTYVPDNCVSQPVVWGSDSCSGTLASTNHGASRSVTNTAGNRTGTASYSCNDGVITLGANSCDRTDKPCVAESRSWAQGSSNCSGSVPALTHTSTASVPTNSTGMRGNATFACSNAVLSMRSNPTPTCSPITCGAGTLSWGTSCQASVSNGNFGQTTGSISNTRSGFTGTADFQCTAAGWTETSSNCRSFNNCPSGTATWGSDCSASYTNLAHGQTISPQTTAANTTGQVTLQCVDGNIAASNASCARTNNPCTSTSLSWGAGCSASSGNINHGTSSNVFNSAANYTGSLSASCNNGTITTSSATCSRVCNSQPVNWGSGCSNTIAVRAESVTSNVNNTASGFTGNADFTCNSAGNQVLQPGSTCAASSCSAGSRNWGSGCSANFPAIASGSSTTQTNAAGGFSGSATFSCSQGNLTYSSGACTPNSCPSQTLSWGSSNQCSAVFSGVSSGQQTTASNTAANFTGSATFSCTNGNLSFASGSCQAAAPQNCPSTRRTWGSCGGQVPNVTHGTTSAGVNNDVAGFNGSATFSCSNGVLSQQTSSCTSSAPPEIVTQCGISDPAGGNSATVPFTATYSGYAKPPSEFRFKVNGADRNDASFRTINYAYTLNKNGAQVSSSDPGACIDVYSPSNPNSAPYSYGFWSYFKNGYEISLFDAAYVLRSSSQDCVRFMTSLITFGQVNSCPINGPCYSPPVGNVSYARIETFDRLANSGAACMTMFY